MVYRNCNPLWGTFLCILELLLQMHCNIMSISSCFTQILVGTVSIWTPQCLQFRLEFFLFVVEHSSQHGAEYMVSNSQLFPASLPRRLFVGCVLEWL